MPLPFSLSQRPSLPSLSWALGSNTSPTSDTNPGEKTPKSAPPRTSQSSVTSSLRRLSGSRSIKHTSIIVSRPTTPANPSPLSAGFGLPAADDDDPFGVLALQKAGLHIKEAGTNYRPGSEAFQYRPAPSSPIWRSSMASAMSGRTGRPSMDGRSSIMTGRRSVAHSRQGSTSTIDTSIQPFDLNALEKNSMRSMSPVQELNDLTRKASDSRSRRSPDSVRKPMSSRPDPLMLSDTDIKRRDETPSPLSRLEVVDEDEDAQEYAKEAEVGVRDTPKSGDHDFESDLERLARELREMADEHEEDMRRSQESSTKRNGSVGDAETVAVAEDDSDDAKTPQRLSARSSENQVTTKDPEPVALVQVSESTAQRISYSDKIIEPTNGMDGDEEDDEDDEDDDGEDYDFDDDEEPVIIEEAVTTQVPVNLRPRHMAMASLQARAQIVSVHLPPPPKVPSRNPRRARQIEDNEPSIQEQLDEYMQRSSPASSHDNDSSSSFSLSRDSFDDGQDIMTQTSQGSDAGSTEVTPTREKGFESITGRLEGSFEEAHSSRLSRDAFDVTEHAADGIQIIVPSEQPSRSLAPLSDDDQPEPLTHETHAQHKSELLDAPAPEPTDRRRPFSFEFDAEDLNQPVHDQVATKGTHETTEGKTSGPKPELKQTAGEPIAIPKLPEDDTSVYEEDFS